jgi:hypothetical protein
LLKVRGTHHPIHDTGENVVRKNTQ